MFVRGPELSFLGDILIYGCSSLFIFITFFFCMPVFSLVHMPLIVKNKEDLGQGSWTWVLQWGVIGIFICF